MNAQDVLNMKIGEVRGCQYPKDRNPEDTMRIEVTYTRLPGGCTMQIFALVYAIGVSKMAEQPPVPIGTYFVTIADLRKDI